MHEEQNAEHPFVPVHAQTGCARCGFTRGHHPTRAGCGWRERAVKNPDPKLGRCLMCDDEATGPDHLCGDCRELEGVQTAEADIHGEGRERRI